MKRKRAKDSCKHVTKPPYSSTITLTLDATWSLTSLTQKLVSKFEEKTKKWNGVVLLANPILLTLYNLFDRSEKTLGRIDINYYVPVAQLRSGNFLIPTEDGMREYNDCGELLAHYLVPHATSFMIELENGNIMCTNNQHDVLVINKQKHSIDEYPKKLCRVVQRPNGQIVGNTGSSLELFDENMAFLNTISNDVGLYTFNQVQCSHGVVAATTFGSVHITPNDFTQVKIYELTKKFILKGLCITSDGSIFTYHDEQAFVITKQGTIYSPNRIPVDSVQQSMEIEPNKVGYRTDNDELCVLDVGNRKETIYKIPSCRKFIRFVI